MEDLHREREDAGVLLKGSHSLGLMTSVSKPWRMHPLLLALGATRGDWSLNQTGLPVGPDRSRAPEVCPHSALGQTQTRHLSSSLQGTLLHKAVKCEHESLLDLKLHSFKKCSLQALPASLIVAEAA